MEHAAEGLGRDAQAHSTGRVRKGGVGEREEAGGVIEKVHVNGETDTWLVVDPSRCPAPTMYEWWGRNSLCEAHDVGLKQVNLRKGRKEERRVSPDGPLRGGVNNNSGERDPRE